MSILIFIGIESINTNINIFCAEQVEGVILSNSYSLSFLEESFKILVTAQRPNSPLTFLDLTGTGLGLFVHSNNTEIVV